MEGERPTPPDAAEQVAALPRRVAHVSYAVIATAADIHGPVSPSEVILFDPESPSLAATCSALRRAINAGLVDRWGWGVYVSTLHAHDLHTALEDRFLSETE